MFIDNETKAKLEALGFEIVTDDGTVFEIKKAPEGHWLTRLQTFITREHIRLFVHRKSEDEVKLNRVQRFQNSGERSISININGVDLFDSPRNEIPLALVLLDVAASGQYIHSPAYFVLFDKSTQPSTILNFDLLTLENRRLFAAASFLKSYFATEKGKSTVPETFQLLISESFKNANENWLTYQRSISEALGLWLFRPAAFNKVGEKLNVNLENGNSISIIPRHFQRNSEVRDCLSYLLSLVESSRIPSLQATRHILINLGIMVEAVKPHELF